MPVDATASRRALLKGAGAAALVSAPAIVSFRTLASSGQIDILMWADYLPPKFIEAFERETGIVVNFTGIGSNEEILARMKTSRGKGFDIVTPTSMRALQWKPLELLQPIDMQRVPVDKIITAMMRVAEQEWSLDGQNIFWLPHIWGTEGLAWRTDLWGPDDGAPSYGDIWLNEAAAGRTMGRPHSVMMGAGLYLERAGDLPPGAMWRAYDSEAEMRPVWEKVTEFCIANKSHVKLFWNDAETQKNALLGGEVIVGQTWDGPPLALKTTGAPVTYRAPVEGALAWIDGISIPTGAKNIDQVYAFIEFAYRKEHAGAAIDDHGYNSPVIGADGFASRKYGANFEQAYPDKALSELKPWPSEPQWYADIRTEYRDKFLES